MKVRDHLSLVTLVFLLAGCTGGGGGAAGSLVGVWRADFNDPTFGPGTIELILMQDGTFSEQSAYAAGALITVYGTFRVFEDETLLRLDIERGEPTETCGPLGCTPILYPAGESYTYTLADDDNLVLVNVYCPEMPVCTFNYVRIV